MKKALFYLLTLFLLTQGCVKDNNTLNHEFNPNSLILPSHIQDFGKRVAEEIKQEMMVSIPQEVVKVNYHAHALKDYIAAKIRKKVFNATGIKPVTFIHFYKKASKEALNLEKNEDFQEDEPEILYNPD